MQNNNTKGADRHHNYNLQYEKSILSSIVFAPEIMVDIMDSLKPGHFYFDPHRMIYEAMLKLHRSDMPIDEIFLDREMGGKYQRELVEVLTANAIANVRPYITEVVEYYRKRELRRLAMEIMKADEEEKNSDAILGEIESFIVNIDEGEEDLGMSYSQLVDVYDQSPPSPVYSTGVSFVDEGLNGGFEMGQLVLMSGDPEAGKTILTLQILKNVSEYAPAVMFAFEFTTRSLVKMQKKTEGDKYRNDNLILIDKGYDIADIERKIKKWKRKGARFFVIDSQMRIENANAVGYTMEERETEKFSRLAKLAHKEDLLIILIIQNSKADAAASVISPMGSKKGAHEASIIMHLKRDKIGPDTPDGEKENRDFILNKNKQTGQHFIKKVKLNPYTLKFTRCYGEGETKEYDGHKKGGAVPVEHKDVKGNTTRKGQFQPSLGSDETVDMPFVGE